MIKQIPHTFVLVISITLFAVSLPRPGFSQAGAMFPHDDGDPPSLMQLPSSGSSSPDATSPETSVSSPSPVPIAPQINQPGLLGNLPSDSPPAPMPSGTTAGDTSSLEVMPQTTTPAPVATFTRDEEVIQWELELAERGFEITKTAGNFSKLIAAKEKLTGYACLRNLPQTLINNPSLNSETCAAQIKGLLALHTKNPIALCARDGIDSPTCLASDKETLLRTKSYSDESSGSALDTKLLDEAKKNKVAELQTKLNEIIIQPSGADDPDGKLKNKKALGALTALLNVTCTPELISFYGPNFSSPTSKNLPKPNEVVRTRLMPAQCADYIARAQQYDPNFAPAMCYQHGRYSPKCIVAIRTARNTAVPVPPDKKLPPRNTGSSKANDGLDSF